MALHTDRIHHLIADGVRDQVYPGAVWAAGDATGTLANGAAGVLDPHTATPMRADTIFDLASLTKVIAVWAPIGTIWDEGRLDLDAPLGAFWPEVTGHPLHQVTARHLLTHTAGVPLRSQLKNLYGTNADDIRAGVLREATHRPPSEAVEYTDRAALILGYLAEHLCGNPLDELAHERIWGPLGMNATRFGPLPAALTANCAPTELNDDTGAHLQGLAHDFSARLLGGVCGIAGAFSTADDLGTFLRYMLTVSGGAQPASFSAAWIKESLTVRTGNLTPARGLFWVPAAVTDPASDVWMHYGFTGTGMWLSPKLGTWAVLLTNKLYNTRDREPLNTIRNQYCELAFT